MSILEFDKKTNEWYRTARFLLKRPRGESKKSRYSTLQEAVMLNPNMPVRNPETGVISSVLITNKEENQNALQLITSEDIEHELESMKSVQMLEAANTIAKSLREFLSKDIEKIILFFPSTSSEKVCLLEIDNNFPDLAGERPTEFNFREDTLSKINMPYAMVCLNASDFLRVKQGLVELPAGWNLEEAINI